jgi:hypothetical protein
VTLFILDYELEGTDHYGGMPWQNCHGYLFLLLILLIVALIVATQLLWQYFVPTSLVAALDHKRHLPPKTKTLALNMVTRLTIAQTKWKPDFSVIYKNTPLLIIIFCKYFFLVDMIYIYILSLPYSYLIINTITTSYPGLLRLLHYNA